MTSEAASLVEVLRARAAAEPDRRLYTFLADGEREDERLTAAELDRKARAIGAALQQAGLAGQRALLLYPPGLEFVAAFLGCLYGGVAAVPAYPPRSNRNLPRLLAIARDARPALALTTADLAAKLGGLAAAVPELEAVRFLPTDGLDLAAAEGWRDPGSGRDTLAFLQYTSGSTATPKGVMITHGNLLHNEEMIRQAFGQSERSVIVGWLPLYHDMGLIGNVLQPLFLGAPCVLMSPLAFLQRPKRWLAAISRYRATTSGGPNFAYDLCVRKIAPHEREDLDLTSWDLAFNGAEPVREETLSRFAEAFAPAGFRRRAFYPCYGLAEATLFVAGPGRDESGATRGAPKATSPDGAAWSVAASFDAMALENGSAEPRQAGSPGSRSLVACGRAWSGQEIAIVDAETATRLADGRVGEIWVRGESVARGYWRNADATAAAFGAALAGEAGNAGGAWLRTGDLGFIGRDEGQDAGDLYVTGRLKDLVIVRGRNLYPQDIELTAERSHPALRAGCGAAFAAERDGEERLVVVQEVDVPEGSPAELGGLDVAPIAEAVRRAVAEEHEVQVDRVILIRPRTIPKTSSGKIQRHAARHALLSGTLEIVGSSDLGAPAPPPRPRPAAPAVPDAGAATMLRAIQAQLAGWAAEALRLPVESIDPAAPLAALGLDSATAIELKHAIESRSGVAVPLADLLEGASLGDLAARIAAGASSGGAASGRPRLVAAERDAPTHPLSYGQRAMWFLSRVAVESPAYIVAAAGRIAGEVDRAALRRALAALTDRHATLRTRFTLDPQGSGEPVARVSPPGEAHRIESIDPLDPLEELVEIVEEDATTWSEGFLEERLLEEAYAPFDLAHGPLLRLALFRRGAGEHRIVLAIHHIAADFWSFEVLLGELAALYRGGGIADLPPLALEYTDFARWQEKLLAGPEGERLWEFWRRELAGPLPTLELPADRPRPAAPRFVGGSAPLRLAPELGERLRAAARRLQTTLFTALLAGYEILLARESGQEELIVGAPTAGRESPALAGLVGYFVNPVALRADLEGAPTGAELVARARERVLAAFRHQEMPFPLLAERLQPERDTARSPIFQAVFVLHKPHAGALPGLAGFALGEPGAEIDLGGLPVESLALADRGAPFDLTLTVAEEGSALWATLVYSAELFDLATVDRMGSRLAALLGGLAEDPGRPISELPGWSAGEAAQATAEEPEGDGFVPPQTAVEEVIAEIWRETLGVDRVGIHDGFLALGGGRRERDRMLARVRKVFQVTLAAEPQGDSPTVAGLAQAIAAELLAGADEATRAEILTGLE